MIATCLTLIAAVAAQPSEPIRLKDNCGELTLRAERPVTIEAEGSSVTGLRLKGNIRWKGGTITAPGGLDGRALAGYAVKIEGAGNSLTSARITGANRGIVVDLATATTIAYNDIHGLRVDGMIISRSSRLSIYGNRIFGFVPHPSRCDVGGTVTYNVAKRDCAGVWTDGSHPDGIQLRNAVTDATISNNTLFGKMQGIAEMNTPTDAPLARIMIRANVLAVEDFHTITLLATCSGCLIAGNIVVRGHPDRKAVIRAGGARRCGNVVQDEVADTPC